LRAGAANLIAFRNASVPAIEMLSARPQTFAHDGVTPYVSLARSAFTNIALNLRDYLGRDRDDMLRGTEPRVVADAQYVREAFIACTRDPRDDGWLPRMTTVANLVIPQLAPADAMEIWRRIVTSPCAPAYSTAQREWLALWIAVTERNAVAMVRHADAMLPAAAQSVGPVHAEYLLLCAMLGRVMQGDGAGAQRVWAQYAPQLYGQRAPALVAHLLAAHAYAAAPIPYLARSSDSRSN
jgi:hypothetical protein